ncbi:MAG: efflux RND transporter periplasmic adaptor subunit [Verrucomicrobiales bacterium]
MTTPVQPKKSSPAVLALKVVLPVALVGIGLWQALALIQSAPKAENGRGGPRAARLVEVAPVLQQTRAVEVEAMGTVKPARLVDLHPRVAGMVAEIGKNFRPGGTFVRGEPILRLEPDDLRLAVQRAEAAVATARASLDLERGQQAVARDELALIREPLDEQDKRWVLREPQLESAAATLRSSEAALEQAKLDLARAEVLSPFNAVVLDRLTDLGGQVNSNMTIATLAGTDTFWVELSVPGDDLRWVRIPGPDGKGGSDVLLSDESTFPKDGKREGRVIGLAARLDENSRMARVLVEVEDPMALRAPGSPRLLLNSYVRARILGPQVPEAKLISRAHLREGDTVWVMNAKDELEIRRVEIIYRGEDEVMIGSGLTEGERVVMTNLRTPVAGMALRVEKQNPAAPETKVAGPAAP